MTTTTGLDDFERHFHDFIHRFEIAYSIGHQALRKHLDEPPITVVTRELEVTSLYVDHALNELLLAHRIFGNAMARDEAWHKKQRALASECDAPVSDIFRAMRRGRLAAFDISADDAGLTATPIDGRADATPRSISAITDTAWEDLPADRPCVGYLVAVEDHEAIILAKPLEDEAIIKLRRAAARSAWGGATTFRDHDYREDVLALLLEPDCFETGSQRGRAFLDYLLCNPSSMRRHDLKIGLRQAIQHQGFASLHPDPKPFVVRQSRRDRAPVLTQLAAAFKDDLDTLRSDLFQLRPAASRYQPTHRGSFAHHMRYLFPDRQLLESFHLESDGSIDHPRLHRRHTYPVGALDLPNSWFRRTGAHPKWSIQRTLTWADTRLDAPVMNALQRAVDHFHIALRWVALLNLHRDHRSSWAGPINYEDLVFGLTTRLPARIADRCLDTFDEPAPHVWSRITAALRRADKLDDNQPLTLARVPRHYSTWINTPGIGDTTDERLQHALFTFAHRWPESEGHTPQDNAATTEACSTISDGLAELDELF